jgi:hypothetical protein
MAAAPQEGVGPAIVGVPATLTPAEIDLLEVLDPNVVTCGPFTRRESALWNSILDYGVSLDRHGRPVRGGARNRQKRVPVERVVAQCVALSLALGWSIEPVSLRAELVAARRMSKKKHRAAVGAVFDSMYRASVRDLTE